MLECCRDFNSPNREFPRPGRAIIDLLGSLCPTHIVLQHNPSMSRQEVYAFLLFLRLLIWISILSLDFTIGISYKWFVGVLVLSVLIGIIGEKFFSEKP